MGSQIEIETVLELFVNRIFSNVPFTGTLRKSTVKVTNKIGNRIAQLNASTLQGSNLM